MGTPTINRPLILLLLGLAILESLIFVLTIPRIGILQFQPRVEILAYFTIAGFGITLFQLSQGQLVQRAKFLTEYLSKIHTDKELSSAFHDLVAAYEDKTFTLVADELADFEARMTYEKKVIDKPVFEPLQKFQRGRPIGQRFYHPLYFQGSEEERKLDGLLGYLDIIGYHHYHGLIKTKDLVAMLNYHLAVLSSRKVIRTYLMSSGEEWFNSTLIQQHSSAQMIPYIYFRHMLGAYVTFNKENARMLKEEQAKIGKKLKGRFL